MAARKPTNELHLTRLYDAPVKMVWDAWCDPKQAAKWWGPRGFTITTHSKDLKVGGHWNYTMHGPDGTDYVNSTVYHEVEKYKKLVYDHGGNPDENRPPLFRVTVTFAEEKGKTRMDMTMALATVEAAQEIKKFIKTAGGNATWDRLAEYLAEEAGKEQFVINRSFEFPVETMFKLWSDPKHLSKWLPPTGFTMEYLDPVEIKPGGIGHYRMSNGKDVEMFGKIRYLEITPPSQMVYTQEFVDQEGNLSRHPMMKAFPAVMRTTVSFVAESADETRVTVVWEPHGDVSATELEAFKAAKPGMTLGWTGSFDKLDEYIVSL